MALLRDIDTVQELSDILVLHRCGLLDARCGSGDQLDVIAFEDEFVLKRCGIDACHSRLHSNAANDFLAQEVTDLDKLVAILRGDVDWEMSIHGAHLVLETSRNANDHVFDVRANRSDGGELLANAEPFLDDQSSFADHGDVQLGIPEGADESTAGSLHRHFAVLHGDRDAVRDLNVLVSADGLHLEVTSR